MPPCPSAIEFEKLDYTTLLLVPLRLALHLSQVLLQSSEHKLPIVSSYSHRAPALLLTSLPEGCAIGRQQLPNHVVVFGFVSVAAEGFEGVTATAYTNDQAMVTKGCRVRAGDEVISLEHYALNAGKAVAVSDIAQDTAAITLDDDLAKGGLYLVF